MTREPLQNALPSADSSRTMNGYLAVGTVLPPNTAAWAGEPAEAVAGPAATASVAATSEVRILVARTIRRERPYGCSVASSSESALMQKRAQLI